MDCRGARSVIRRVFGSVQGSVEVIVTGINRDEESIVGVALEASGQRKYDATIADPPRPARMVLDKSADAGVADGPVERCFEKTWLRERAAVGQRA